MKIIFRESANKTANGNNVTELNYKLLKPVGLDQIEPEVQFNTIRNKLLLINFTYTCPNSWAIVNAALRPVSLTTAQLSC